MSRPRFIAPRFRGGSRRGWFWDWLLPRPPWQQPPDPPVDPIPPETPEPPPVGDYEQFALELLVLHNDARKRVNLRPLVMAARLDYGAQDHSDWMARTGIFRHSGDNVFENIAAGQRTPQAVFDAWMGSRGHRANILEPRIEPAGFGLAYRGGYPYWTAQFNWA